MTRLSGRSGLLPLLLAAMTSSSKGCERRSLGLRAGELPQLPSEKPELWGEVPGGKRRQSWEGIRFSGDALRLRRRTPPALWGVLGGA
jgi:hypothetical protein